MGGGTWPPKRCEPITRTDKSLVFSLDGADNLIDGFVRSEKLTACLPAAAGLRRQAQDPCRGYLLALVTGGAFVGNV